MKINILTAGLLLVIAFLLIRGCNSSKKIDDLSDQIDLEKSSKDSLLHKFNKKTGEWEYSKQTYAATNGRLTDFLAKQDKELAKLKKSKKASVGIITKTQTVIDTVVINKPTFIGDSIRSATVETKHYKADIISWPNKTSLAIIAWDSVKYSIGQDYRLVAQHSNPYVKVTELNSFYVKPDKKKKNWKYVVGGLVAGGLVYGLSR